MSIGTNAFLRPKKASKRGLSTRIPSRLNQIGVGLLVIGQYTKALKAFTKALEIVKVLTPQMGPRTSNREGQITSQKRQTAPSKETTTIKPVRQLQHGSLRSVLLTKPIIVEEEEHLPDEGRSYLMRLSVAIIYNLALVNQAISLRQKEHQEQRNNCSSECVRDDSGVVKSMMKTLRLYELSCQLQLREDIVLEHRHSLARLNNMAHLHVAIGNEHQAQQCFLRLSEGSKENTSV